jgi:hypothetical protein
MNDNQQDIVLRTVLKEIHDGQIDGPLWQRAKDAGASTPDQIQAIYIQMRVKAMQETVKNHVRTQIKQEMSKLNLRAADFLNAKDLMKKK